MAKQAVLLHGTGGNDKDYYWFSTTKNFLEENNFKVWWPQLPNTESPSLQETLNFVEAHRPQLDSNSVVIGHSSACPLILSMLQANDITVRQVILVGGYYQELEDNEESAKMLPESFDWQNISSKADEIIMINSDNDPWGCTDDKARPAAIALGAKLIVNTGQGHMGSTTFDQPYQRFELLNRLLRVE